jgi:pyrroline-5-carboxylate reductase
MKDKKIGIIGYGSMGRMIVNSIYKFEPGSKLFVSNRTKDKLTGLKTGITVRSSNAELVKESDLVFICVRPVDVKDVLVEVKDALSPDKHVISIAGSVRLSQIEKYHSGKISRILPTLISEVNEGITLACHNPITDDDDKKMLYALLNYFSSVKTVNENDFDILSVVTSCAPGLIAAIFDVYVKSVIKKTSLDENEITEMMIKTLYGTSKLFIERQLSFEETISRVATKGGSTEVGTAVIKEHLPIMFDLMIMKILERHKSRDKIIDDQFEEL